MTNENYRQAGITVAQIVDAAEALKRYLDGFDVSHISDITEGIDFLADRVKRLSVEGRQIAVEDAVRKASPHAYAEISLEYESGAYRNVSECSQLRIAKEAAANDDIESVFVGRYEQGNLTDFRRIEAAHDGGPLVPTIKAIRASIKDALQDMRLVPQA